MGLMEPACVSFLMGSGGGLWVPHALRWEWGGGGGGGGFRKGPHLLEAAFGHGEPRADGDDGVGVAHGQDLLPQRGDAFQLQLLALQRLQQLLTEGTEGGGEVGWGGVGGGDPPGPTEGPTGWQWDRQWGVPALCNPRARRGTSWRCWAVQLSCSCSWRWRRAAAGDGTEMQLVLSCSWQGAAADADLQLMVATSCS